jgi:hypothetical protein
MLHAAGFESVTITHKNESKEFIKDWVPGSGAENFFVSADVEARKSTACDGQRVHAAAPPALSGGFCGAPAPATTESESSGCWG